MDRFCSLVQHLPLLRFFFMYYTLKQKKFIHDEHNRNFQSDMQNSESPSDK